MVEFFNCASVPLWVLILLQRCADTVPSISKKAHCIFIESLHNVKCLGPLSGALGGTLHKLVWWNIHNSIGGSQEFQEALCHQHLTQWQHLLSSVPNHLRITRFTMITWGLNFLGWNGRSRSSLSFPKWSIRSAHLSSCNNGGERENCHLLHGKKGPYIGSPPNLTIVAIFGRGSKVLGWPEISKDQKSRRTSRHTRAMRTSDTTLDRGPKVPRNFWAISGICMVICTSPWVSQNLTEKNCSREVPGGTLEVPGL
jgi:hypothetical protein